MPSPSSPRPKGGRDEEVIDKYTDLTEEQKRVFDKWHRDILKFRRTINRIAGAIGGGEE